VCMCVCVCACAHVCVCACVRVRTCTCGHEWKFVLTVFWYFALRWAMCSSLEKWHIKENITVTTKEVVQKIRGELGNLLCAVSCIMHGYPS